MLTDKFELAIIFPCVITYKTRRNCHSSNIRRPDEFDASMRLEYSPNFSCNKCHCLGWQEVFGFFVSGQL